MFGLDIELRDRGPSVTDCTGGTFFNSAANSQFSNTPAGLNMLSWLEWQLIYDLFIVICFLL